MSPQTPWWKNATIYQIYPASYKDSNGDGIGDLPGILGQLDYIQSLGVDAIWICPMYKSPQVDMGYDVADYEDVHGPYGTVADVEAIIAACHGRGLRILLDLVINHTSDQHAWFKESRLGKSSPKRDWYIWRPAKYDADGVRRPPNNWRSIFGGSAWEWDEISEEYYLHLFAVEQPDVNWENSETRAALYESAMEFWLRKGIDGFRVDTVNMYSKDQSFLDAPIIDPNHEHQLDASLFCNGPRIHEFLHEMGQILLKYNAVTVGELPCTPEVTDVLKYVSEKEQQLSMVFQFDIVDVGRGKDFPFQTTPRNWTLPELRASVKRTQTLMDGTTDGWSTTFLENHDQARSISRWGSEETPELWAASAKMLAMLVASLSGTLYIYQGQEIGMVNAPLDWDISEYKDLDSLNYYNYIKNITGNDPVALEATKVAIAHLARDHARIPMQWDSTPNAGFSSEGVKTWMRVHDKYPTLNVEKQNSDPTSVLSFWRDLLRVRRANPNVFAQGVFEDTDPSHGSVFIFQKHSEREKLVVTLNFSGEIQSADLAEHIGSGTPKLLAQNYENDALNVLQPYEGRIYLVGNISFSSFLERDMVKN